MLRRPRPEKIDRAYTLPASLAVPVAPYPASDPADLVAVALAKVAAGSATHRRATAEENAAARQAASSVRRVSDLPAALDRLLGFVTAHPDDERMQVYVGRALNQVQDRRALTVWHGIGKRFPMSKDALLHGLRWTGRLEGPSAAQQLFRTRFPREPVEPAALLLYGRGLLEIGELEAAEQAFARLAAAPDATERILTELSQLHLGQNQLARAQAVAERAQEMFGFTPGTIALLDKVTESVKALRRALRPEQGEDNSPVAAVKEAFRLAAEVGARRRGIRRSSVLGPVVLINGSLGFGGAERQFTKTALQLQAAVTSGRQIGGRDVAGPIHVICRSLESRSGADFFAPELRRAGLDVGEYETFRDYGGRPRHSAARPLFPYLDSLPAQMRDGLLRLSDLLVFLEPDVVHIWQDGSALAVGLAAVAAGARRILLSVRTLPPQDRAERDKPEYAAVYQALLAQPNVALVANSHIVAARYEAWLSLRRGSVHVIPNGVEQTDARGSADTLALWRSFVARCSAKPFIVGSVLRFDANKRPLLWLDMAAALAARDEAARFVLVGDGPLMPQALDHADALGIADRVLFVGRSTEVGFWLSHMDVFVLLSRHEGLPNALIEAQVAGVPVVTTPAGGAAEALDPRLTGTVLTEVESPSADSVVTAILGWRREPSERAALADMISARAIERFSMERMTESTVDLYFG